MIITIRQLTALIIFLHITPYLFASVYYVSSNTGNDNNPGSYNAPFKTVQKAADILNEGDTCFIRGGIYREAIALAHSGTSEYKRIVYKAYLGEMPVLTGSEQINTWKKQHDNIYKVDIPNIVFGSYNPFATNLYDPNGWLLYGAVYHLGAVYVNGLAYKEFLGLEDLKFNHYSYWATVGTTVTTIFINYSGASSPNMDLTEINVRPFVIKGENRQACNYITLDGLTIRHGSTNWSSNEGVFSGIIDINAGGWWVIQNCRISDGRTCGVQAGMGFGHHIVRNNIIERFGQAGLIGNGGGWSNSLIEGNIFQDINVHKEFGGAETAGFKAHNVIDMTVRNNVFRRIYTLGKFWAFGVWIDWRNQGNRITGNVFSEMNCTAAIEVESSYGPTLIDNNIFAISSDSCYAIQHNSANTIVVHNLFFTGGRNFHLIKEQPYMNWYRPHSNIVAGGDKIFFVNNKSYNNFFIGSKSGPFENDSFTGDYNAYFQNASKHSGGYSNSFFNSDFNTKFTVQNNDSGTVVNFNCDNKIMSLKCPLISNSFIGICTPTGQGLEKKNGLPIIIDVDINGSYRDVKHIKVGSLQNLSVGKNTVSITAGIKRSILN